MEQKSQVLKAFNDLYGFMKETITRTEFLEAFKSLTIYVQKTETRLIEHINTQLEKVRGKDGKNGVNGRDGIDGKDGVNGKDGMKGEKGDKGDPGKAYIAFRGPQGEKGNDGSPDTPEQVRDKLESLNGDNRLDKSAIKGIDNIEESIKQIQIRSVRGGAGKGVGLYINGAKKLLTAQIINIVPGSGISVSYSYANGRNDITISATGSASLTPITVTGTIDDSNKSFTAASTPNLVIVNGAAYRDGHGATISGTSITLDNPVGTGGDIYAL